MKTLIRSTLVLLCAWGGLFSTAQAIENKDISPEMVASMQASAEQTAQLAAVQTDRGAVIASIVSDWIPMAQQHGFDVSTWGQEFQSTLEAAPDAQLLALQDATDYGAVQAILQGRSAPVDVDGLSIQDLGDLSEDLTFTPLNPPCRIVDTRQIGGFIPASSVKNYYVHGIGATMSAQGGNAAGCTAPKGEPVGAAINLAVVSPQSPSHLRIWPYGYTMPTVSYLNYPAGQNLANSGIISTAYLQSYDISVYNGSKTHYIADVMGFFYPAQQAAPGLSNTGQTTTMGILCTNYSGGNVTITVPGPGYITVSAQAWIVLYGDGATSKHATIYLGNTATDCTLSNFSQGYHAMSVTEPSFTGSKHVTIPVTRTFYVSSAGTYTYYLNGASDDGSANFWYAGMQAHFTAN